MAHTLAPAARTEPRLSRLHVRKCSGIKSSLSYSCSQTKVRANILNSENLLVSFDKSVCVRCIILVPDLQLTSHGVLDKSELSAMTVSFLRLKRARGNEPIEYSI